MKRKLLVGLASLLLVACGSNTTKQNGSTAKKPVVDTGTTDTSKSSNTEWKWDLLNEKRFVAFGSKYEIGVAKYDREDLSGMVYMGSSEANGGKLDMTYFVEKNTTTSSKYKINDINDLESKFLIKENSMFFRSLSGLLPATEEFEWTITEKSTKKHLDIEFVKIKAEIKGYNTNRLSTIHEKKPELKSYVEGYFTILDTDDGKQLFTIYRNWTNETSKKTEEKSKRVVDQLIESIRVKQ